MNETNDFDLWRDEMMKHLMRSVPQDKLLLHVALAMFANEFRIALEWPVEATLELSDAYVAAAKEIISDSPETGRVVLVEKLGELKRKYGTP